MKKVANELIDEIMKDLSENTASHGIDKTIIEMLHRDWKKSYENLQMSVMGMKSLDSSTNIDDSREVEHSSSFEQNRSSLEFSDSISFSEESENLEIQKAEEIQNSYVLCLYVKVHKIKGRFKCGFKHGFANPGSSYDLPFNNGNGELEWENNYK